MTLPDTSGYNAIAQAGQVFTAVTLLLFYYKAAAGFIFL